MSLSYLESLVGKNVVLFNYLRNVFKNKIDKMVESENEYVLYLDMGTPDRSMHRITYPGIYFITDVMIKGINYIVYLKKQIDLKKFALVSSVSASEYFVFSYRKAQYKDGEYILNALEFEIGGFKRLTFNYDKYIVVKAKRPDRKRVAVCLGNRTVLDDVNSITCNDDWYNIE
ncbi:hypothetical protein AVU39_gp29 [Sulfolobus monocaudavirus SMV2]|uniref:hypothetical protein n=1 Tax=Sulfolobus monocaudavirus SMV2 TaxID=1580591 RepID=UPI0006D2E222|nr:hypothetical protein AVU39_gp29 [Sulfolobus monocaudavirus SMV2]AIZ11363.1 hypothetical protein [Sulfolobus monocaudavirus SMV2]